MTHTGKMKLRHSILWKIGGVLIALMTLILLVFGVSQYRTLRANALANLMMLADSTVERLRKSLVKPLWEFDMVQLEQGILAEMGHEAIVAIVVNNEKGQRLRGKSRDPKGQIIDAQDEVTGDLIVRQADMQQGERNFGTVAVSLTPRFMQQELRQATHTLIITFGRGRRPGYQRHCRTDVARDRAASRSRGGSLGLDGTNGC